MIYIALVVEAKRGFKYIASANLQLLATLLFVFCRQHNFFRSAIPLAPVHSISRLRKL